ncbi:MAG TPA: hypothetical protein VKD65_12945 [Candidatus Angelobacter sp.]|nr:hypothetical protein [Candidatus Angelobacter sp.]
MRPSRPVVLVLASGLALCIALPLINWALAYSKPDVQLTSDNVRPHQMEDLTQKAILRDYTLAWEALTNALANNTAAPLNNNFVGFALEKLTQRVKDQQNQGLKTRIIDRGHKVNAIFYSRDGSAIELRDTAILETQVLDGNTLLHSDRAQVQYLVVMTGGADRWQVRVLESVPGGN